MFANMHLVSCFLDFSINHLIKPTNNGPDCFMGGRADISAVGSFFEVVYQCGVIERTFGF